MISFFWAGEAIKVNPMTDENDIKTRSWGEKCLDSNLTWSLDFRKKNPTNFATMGIQLQGRALLSVDTIEFISRKIQQ